MHLYISRILKPDKHHRKFEKIKSLKFIFKGFFFLSTEHLPEPPPPPPTPQIKNQEYILGWGYKALTRGDSTLLLMMKRTAAINTFVVTGFGFNITTSKSYRE